MNWQFFVALRYLTAKRREKFISLISLISILGVALGVAALIIVIGVMSGFDADLKDKITGTNSHIEILSDYGVAPTEELSGKVLDTEHVAAVSFFLNGQVLIRRGDDVIGIIAKGVDPKAETKTTRLGEYMTAGSLELTRDGIILGSELAKKMHVKLGDSVSIISPAYIEGKDLKVTGIFTSGMYEYDSNLAYVTIDRAQDLLSVKGLVSGLAVKVNDALKVAETKTALQSKLGPDYFVRTWMDSNKNLLSALKLEKTVMFIILTLIVMVACFNIASALIMTVLEKTKDIGILKAVGATNRGIMSVFTLLGGFIGLIGTTLGAATGIAISLILKKYKFISLPKDIYYIDILPVKLEMQDIVIIILASIAISLLATLYPSYKASRLDPVEALRYE